MGAPAPVEQAAASPPPASPRPGPQTANDAQKMKASTSPPLDTAKLQAELEKANQWLLSPGMVMAVQVGGGAPWIGATGVRTVGAPGAMAITDQFRLGSISKNFLGTCVLQLIGEGKIGLDDSLEKWLPGVFKNIDEKPITVSHLLNHTSGIENFSNDDTWTLKVYQTPPGYTFKAPTELLSFADDLRAQDVAKGTVPKFGEFYYSNTNYILLAMIATKADGIADNDYVSLIKKRIIDRLGLKNTVISLPGQQTIPDAQQNAFINWQNHLGLTKADCAAIKPPCTDTDTPFLKQDMSNAWSAGSVVSTAEDVVKYLNAEMKGDLLTPELRKIQQTYVSTYESDVDAGRSVFITRPYNLIGHRGEIFGFSATVQYQQEKDTTIVVLANRTTLTKKDDENYNIDAVAINVFKSLYPEYSQPQPPVPAPAAPVAAVKKSPPKVSRGKRNLFPNRALMLNEYGGKLPRP